jgi:uncharacterized delta-60 repeat protein
LKLTNNNKACLYSVFVFFLFTCIFTLIQSCKKLEFERVVRLKTGTATDITTNSALITGFFRDWGEGGITQYGHCWSVNKDPTRFVKTRSEYDDLRGGYIYSIMDSLLSGTTYYVRAYAIYRGETIYGDSVSFTTNEASSPEVTTVSPSNITDSSATCGGNVTDDGGAIVTARGVCWNTLGNATISDSCTNDGNGTGEYTSNITGLSPNTTYYVRAYATNIDGTAYGDELIFTTKIKIIWQKFLGGRSSEQAYSIQQTTDGGYIFAGYTTSDDDYITGYNGYYDYLIMKLTSTGELEWYKVYGGSAMEIAYSIQQTIDGGYIVAGKSASDNGDVLENNGETDIWILKLTSAGDIDWQKSLGQNSIDEAYSIQQTYDTGYIIAGSTSSSSTMSDYWIVKLTSAGNIDWQKSIGGSNGDKAYYVRQTSDEGYIIAGESNSNDGDVSGYHGDTDCWIVKLTSTGEIDWQKSLGGSDWDEAYSIHQTTDEGYIFAGASDSNDGDVSGNHGTRDCWIVKLTSTGEIDWQKSLGGSYRDEAYSIQQTTDGGYIFAGYTRSDDGDVTERNGEYDYWIVKLTSAGEIDWQRPLGGSDDDIARFIIQTSDGNYIIAGASCSDDGDVEGNIGSYDCWIVKISDN